MNEKLNQNTENGNLEIDLGWKSLMNATRESARAAGQIPATGADILDKNGQVIGRVPERPGKFEMSNNVELDRNVHDVLVFLDFHSFEQATVLAREDHNYTFRRKFEHMPGYQERVDRLLAEREYIDSLQEWAVSSIKSEEQMDGSYDYSDVMEKISEDMKQNRAAKMAYEEKLRGMGVDTAHLENPVMLAMLEDYDKKHGAMFRTRKLIHQRYNLGREIEE